MLTGKRFVLGRDTVGVRRSAEKPSILHIPSGASVQVVSERTHEDGTINVLWEGAMCSMFLVDLEERGTEIIELSASA